MKGTKEDGEDGREVLVALDEGGEVGREEEIALDEDEALLEDRKGGAVAPMGPGDEKYKRWEGKRGRILMIVTAAGLCSALSTSIFLPAVPGIMRDLETNEFMVSLTVSVFFLLLGTLPMAWGPLSDRFSRRKAILGGVFIHCITSVLCGFSWSIESLIAFRVLQAIGGSSLLVLGAGTVSDIYPPEIRGDALGIYTMAPSVGPVVGPVVGGVIAEYLGWKAIFFTLSIVSFTIFVVAFFVIPETLYYPGVTYSTPIFQVMTQPLRFLANPIVLALSLCNALCHASSITMLLLYPTLLERYGFSTLILGICYIPFGVGAVSGAKIGGVLCDKFNNLFGRGGRLITSQYGVTIFPLCALLFGYSVYPLWILILSLGLSGFFFSLQRPGVYAFLIEMFPNQSSSISATLLFVQYLLGFIGLTVGPLIWTTNENRVAFFGGAGAAAFVLAFPVFYLMYQNWGLQKGTPVRGFCK